MKNRNQPDFDEWWDSLVHKWDSPQAYYAACAAWEFQQEKLDDWYLESLNECYP